MDQSLEQWRPVVGYEGYYEVSDQGSVRSMDRVITRRGNSPVVSYKGRLLCSAPDKGGYKTVVLCRDGRMRTVRVHALVAAAFLGDRPKWSTQVNHKNLDKSNNSAINLEWSNHGLNQRHRRPQYLYKGEPMSCLDLAEIAGISLGAMHRRLKRGWSVERAVSTPKREVAGGDGYCLWVE